MTKATLHKITPATESKPKEVDRRELRAKMAGKRLLEVGLHIEDLSNLLYQNQDTFKNTELVVGIESLLAHYAAFVKEMAEDLQRGEI